MCRPRSRFFAVASLLFLALVLTAPLFGQAGSASFNYIANPPRVQVSPETVLPKAIPECHTTDTSVPTSPIIYCYSPGFVWQAYDLLPLYAAGVVGSGQTIVIVDAYGSPTIQSDLRTFDLFFGLPDPEFEVICPLGCPAFNPRNAPHDQLGWSFETTLDVEWAHAIAPFAKIVLAVAPSSGGNALNSVVQFVVQHYPGSILSQSFGVPEAAVRGNNAQLLQAHANYQAAVSQMITVLAAAGDNGATNGSYPIANPLYPSSDPLVTGIGGTEGMPLGSGLVVSGAYGAEQVWNEAWTQAATGGASSLIFNSPDYQSGLGFDKRTTPDVAYNAAVDGGVLIYYSALPPPAQGFYIIGGTSAGSPQWAAIFALANQERAAASKDPLGFVNPSLYSLATSGSYGTDFHDITSGNNILSGSTIGFSAGTGYDRATGWGTPDAAHLVADLAALP